jgi:hypothetical protein
VGPPNDASVEEKAQEDCHRKRPSTCLAESGETGARTYQRGNAIGSCSSVKEDGCGRVEDKEDSNPSLVTRSALMGSSPSQEFVQEEAPGQIPSGWTRVKLEPDC